MMCATAVHSTPSTLVRRPGLTISALNRYDPTRTLTLRNRFVSDMNRRFREVRGEIRRAVVDQDVFGLRNGDSPGENGWGVLTNVQRRAFDFPRSQDKVGAFMNWLEDLGDQRILQISAGTRQQIGEAVDQAWTNIYIEDTYKRGVQRARYEMTRAGYDVPTIAESGGWQAVMGMPMHADRLGLLYTRTFTELKGVTDAMDQQISRVLAQGLADGDHPSLLARKLNATISGKGIGELGLTDTLGRYIPAERRARMIARTEVIRAHHQASIQEYRNWQVEGVRVQAEWRTAGDEQVCPDCEAMHEEVFTLEEIQNKIPAHPNCRCFALPVEARGPAGPQAPVDPDEWNDWQDLTLEDLGEGEAPKTVKDIMEQMKIKDEKLRRAGVRGLTYDADIDAQALRRINMAGDNLGDVFARFPELKAWSQEAIEGMYTEYPNLFSLRLYSRGNIPNAGNGVLAQYSPFLKEIRVARSALVRTEHHLVFGKHNVGLDYATSLRHEYGHHVWFKKMSPKQRTEWRRYFSRSGGEYNKTLGKAVSEYGSSNVEELFAESFAAYTSPLYKAGTMPTEIETLLSRAIGARRRGL